jgi:hypothetical protein
MSAHTLAPPPPVRGVRTLALAASLALLLAVAAFSAWRFITPPDSASALTAVRLAPAADFAPGSVTAYRLTPEGKVVLLPASPGSASELGSVGATADPKAVFYVVRFPDGDFRVLSGRSTHLGQLIVWRPDFVPEVAELRGVFYGLGSGPMWTIDGTRIFGPAPRDMDYYDAHIEDGTLVIDLSSAVRGDSHTGMRLAEYLPPPYDVTSEDWPTSGWPAGPSGATP